MKQNSSILFHFMRHFLRNRYSRWLLVAVIAACLWVPAGALAAEPQEYLVSFDPANGFKLQRDLTEIFLQLAGSLESYGSPEPYLRQMAKEHARIEALYLEKTGTAARSFRPAYMTDAYIDRLASNWKLLSPKIGLEPYAKEVGHLMRNAVKGTRGNGTLIVDILNRHQKRVFDEMAGKGSGKADFEALKEELVRELELDKATVDEERYEISRRDAVSFALGIHGLTTKLFKRLDEGMKPADAERVKAVILSVITDCSRMAESELRVGLAEWALRNQSVNRK